MFYWGKRARVCQNTHVVRRQFARVGSLLPYGSGNQTAVIGFGGNCPHLRSHLFILLRNWTREANRIHPGPEHKERGAIWTHSSGVQSIMQGSHGGMTRDCRSRCICSQEANKCWDSAHILFHSAGETQPTGCCCPRSRWVFPQLNPAYAH